VAERTQLKTWARIFGVLSIAWLFMASPASAENLRLSKGTSEIGARGLVYRGRDVFLVGSGSFWLLNDPYYYNADGSTNLSRLRDHLKNYSPETSNDAAMGVIRVSAFGTPVRYKGIDSSAKRYPCARSDRPGAADGGNKFDCSKMDAMFFRHVLDVVREADARQIVIGIILFDEIPLEKGDSRWIHNPFCPENNINGYGLPSCSSNAVPEFYSTAAGNLRNHQDRIVEEFVDVLRDEPNVFFFVSNEYTGGRAWRDRQIATIDRRNAFNDVDLLHVTMSFGPGPSDISDGVSPDTNKSGVGDDAFRRDGRPAIAQRDHRTASGNGPKRQNFWQRFMDGAASAGTRDDYSGATPPAMVFQDAARDDQILRRFVGALSTPLSKLRPNDAPFEGGWDGRISIGNEYAAYATNSSGTIRVDLSAETGSWTLFEFDPKTLDGPVNRGERDAGGFATWSVRSGETAVRIVPNSNPPTPRPKPAPPRLLEVK